MGFSSDLAQMGFPFSQAALAPFLPPARLWFWKPKCRRGTHPLSQRFLSPQPLFPGETDGSVPVSALAPAWPRGQPAGGPNTLLRQPQQSPPGNGPVCPGWADIRILLRVFEQVSVCPSRHLTQQQHECVSGVFPMPATRQRFPWDNVNGPAEGWERQEHSRSGHVLPHPRGCSDGKELFSG